MRGKKSKRRPALFGNFRVNPNGFELLRATLAHLYIYIYIWVRIPGDPLFDT